MTRAVVIKTYGNPQIGGALVDAVSRKVIPLDEGELKTVKAELARLNAVNGVRVYGDEKRWNKTRRRLARKYSTKPVGAARGAILGGWALVWSVIFGAARYLQAWNREA